MSWITKSAHCDLPSGDGMGAPEASIQVELCARDQFELRARLRLAGARGAHVVEERRAAHDQFEPQVHEVARLGENLPQRPVGEVDVVGVVDDQHRLAQIA